MQGKIDIFNGANRFLSNFYPVGSSVLYHNVRFPTVEHAYQAAKAFFASQRNPEILQAYAVMPKAGMTKALGKIIRIDPEWDAYKILVMEELLRQKFKEPVLKKLLLETCPSELIEGNTWGDTFWGVCDGVGENNLGKLLMKIRTEIGWEPLVS